MPVRFEDNSIKVKAEINDKTIAFLYEAAESVKGQAAQLTKVASGQLKGSWHYSIDTSAKSARIGSSLENAIWNELGTGEYAAGGNGRKGGWKYKDAEGNWHFTYGKKARHTLQKAFTAKKNAIIEYAKRIFGELGR